MDPPGCPPAAAARSAALQAGSHGTRRSAAQARRWTPGLLCAKGSSWTIYPSTSGAIAALWDEWAREIRRRRVSTPGRENTPTWGIWSVPESEVGMLPDGSRRQGRDRARLRHRLRLGMARPARRARRRHRQLGGAARHGAPAAAPARSRLPAPARQRRGGSLPRRQLRLRHLGVRRLPVGRSAALGSRGGAPAAPGRPAVVPGQLVPADAVHAAGGRRRRDRSAAAAGVRHVPRSNGRATPASSSTSRTATGSACCGARASRSRIWSSCAPPPTRRRATRSSRSSGRGSGRARRCGRCASAVPENRPWWANLEGEPW